MLILHITVGLFLTLSSATSSINHPVVLVPGDGGNQLEAKLNKSQTVHYICEKTTSDYFTIWLNIEEFIKVVIDCWVDNTKLSYDNVTRTTSNQPGVDIKVPGWGSSETVEWLDPLKLPTGKYFNDIANALVEIGYVRNVSLRGAPFDFRKAPNELQDYFVNLKTLIEETYYINGNTTVVMVAHSMGAPMSHYFLKGVSQEWKDKYIRSLVTLSGAWAGSFKPIKIYYMGDDLGVYVLPGGTLKEMEMTMTSIAWLVPWPQFWKPNEVFVQTPNKNYSHSNLKEYFYDIDYMTGWEMVKDQSKYWDFTPPGVELHCIHGSNVPTNEKMVFKKKEDFPGGTPEFISGDGDGTVNGRSLNACKVWDEDPKTKLIHMDFPGVDHQGALHDQRIIDYIVNLVQAK